MGINTRRRFSDEEKMNIIEEATTFGIAQTLRKHEICSTLYYKWKSKFIESGITSLKGRAKDPETIRLQYENEKLKNLIGQKEYELKLKDELLKKTILRQKTERI